MSVWVTVIQNCCPQVEVPVTQGVDIGTVARILAQLSKFEVLGNSLKFDHCTKIISHFRLKNALWLNILKIKKKEELEKISYLQLYRKLSLCTTAITCHCV